MSTKVGCLELRNGINPECFTESGQVFLNGRSIYGSGQLNSGKLNASLEVRDIFYAML